MTEKSSNQLVRILHKVASRYPLIDEPVIMTDIHIRVNQETGDAMAFDDDDKEITRIIVDEWINNTDEQEVFYKGVALELRKLLCSQDENGNALGHSLGLLMPYSFVLEDENGGAIEELYLADSEADTLILGEPFMEGLSDDLDDFIKDLLK